MPPGRSPDGTGLPSIHQLTLGRFTRWLGPDVSVSQAVVWADEALTRAPMNEALRGYVGSELQSDRCGELRGNAAGTGRRGVRVRREFRTGVVSLP